MRTVFYMFFWILATGILHAQSLVTVSIPPQRFFVQKIAGDTLKVNVLLPSNVDEHNFEFKPSVMKQLEKSDILFTVGLEFEEIWLPRFRQNYKNLVIADTQQGIALQTMEHHHHHEHHDVFHDNAVKDRELSDWEGEYRSIYPYLLDGSLDHVLHAKAKADPKKDFKAYKDYYSKGYKTDVDKIVIKDDSVSFYRKNQISQAKYLYKGYEILTYESGNKGVRYQFEAIDPKGAPKYIQFSDHQIKPHKVDHFHLYWGDSSFKDLLKELENWPTFYKNSLSKQEIIKDMLAHLQHDKHDEAPDPHTWLDPLLVKQQATTITQALIRQYPQHKALYENNLQAFHQELDEIDATIKKQLSALKTNKFIVYHPSWGYFASRYGLEQIPVEIEGKEPKPADLANIIKIAKENAIKVIFVQPGFSKKSAKAIANECGAEIVEINHLSEEWASEILKTAQKISDSLKLK